MDLLFGSGISQSGCTLDAAEICGVVRRSGSHYYFGDAKLGNGRDNVLEALSTQPQLLDEIGSAVKQHMTSSEDQSKDLSTSDAVEPAELMQVLQDSSDEEDSAAAVEARERAA